MVGKASENPEETDGPAEQQSTTTPPMKPTSDKTEATTSDATTSDHQSDRKSSVTSSKSQSNKPQSNASRSKAALKADLDTLETRLKRADKVTRKSVQSLETVVSTLQASLKTAQASQKGQLTKQINRLTRRMEAQVDDTKALIRRELQDALAGAGASGDVDALEAAMVRASERIDAAEISQATAITRVNRHLADIARAVDTRLKEQSAARDADLANIDQTIEKSVSEATTTITDRVAIIERDSARAFDKIGETMEQLNRKIEQRRSASDEGIGERVSELAAQTQSGFNAYQSRVEQRFEEMEARHIAVGTGVAERAIERVNQELDDKIEGLKSRLAELERRPVDMPAVPAPVITATRTEIASPTDADATIDAGNIQSMRDRLTALRKPDEDTLSHVASTSVGQTETANPYAEALGVSANGGRGRPLPTAPFSPPPPTVDTKHEMSPVVAFPAPLIPGQAQDAPPLPPFQVPVSPNAHSPSNFEPAPLPDAVYANPAYADDGTGLAAGVSDSPKAIRIGSGAASPRRKFDLSSLPLPSGPLRIALLAGAAIIVAVLAGRMILGTGSLSSSAPQSPAQTVTQSNPATPNATMPVQGYTLPAGTNQAPPITNGGPITNTGLGAPSSVIDPQNAPIGDYVETQPVTFDDAALDTLEAAVEAGNPIAQFQMGLAKLDAGETEDGAALVREAASANQPAALYRLAKLYETGEGVPRDDTLARQLIERAARGGNRIAMHDLGLYYAEGRGGVDMNMLTAKAWFEQAARRDVVDSQYNLAVLSESPDTGADPDPQDALFWYSIAARQGDQFAIQRRDALRASFDAETLSAIDARLAAFQPRAIDEAANGIFTNLPWVQADAPATRDQIRTAQTRLAALGYQVGTPDGIMGERTRTAITAFQRENGMRETGEVNAALLNRLSRSGGA